MFPVGLVWACSSAVGEDLDHGVAICVLAFGCEGRCNNVCNRHARVPGLSRGILVGGSDSGARAGLGAGQQGAGLVVVLGLKWWGLAWLGGGFGPDGGGSWAAWCRLC